MSTIGSRVVFSKTTASAATLSGEFDLSGAWAYTYLEVPTLTSNPGFIYVQAATQSGGTYRRVYHPTLNSSTVGTNIYRITSGLSNLIIPMPNGLRYVKIETDNTINDGCTWKILCGN